MKFINLFHWLDIIYVSVGWKVYAKSGKTLRSGRKVAFPTLEYIPENEPATKDFTTGLLTNTSILIFIDLMLLFQIFFLSSFCFSRFVSSHECLIFHTQYWGHYLLFVVLSFFYQFTLSSSSNPWNPCRKWREAGTISCYNPLGYHPQRQTICSSCSWYS